MTTTWRACLWVFCFLLLPASAGFAQSNADVPPGPPPAHLSVIEGQASVDRDGRSEPAVSNLPLLDGDRLRTADGRLEVILPDGSLLHLDRATTVDMLAADLFRLLQGRVTLIVRGVRDPQRAVRYQIDAPVASVQTGGPGEFRVWSAESAGGREVELAVFSGQAILASEAGTEEVRAGERSVVRDGLAPSAPQYFNSARWDEFGRWSAARRDERLGTVSVQYLPSELTVYASTFDQVRDLAQRGRRGRGLVPHGGRRLAPVFGGLLAQLSVLGHVLGWRRPVGLADTSLRPLGLLVQPRLVLEARARVGPGVGVVGLFAGVRELVPARPARLPGLRPFRRPGSLLREPRGSLARMDGGAPSSVRHADARAPRRGRRESPRTRRARRLRGRPSGHQTGSRDAAGQCRRECAAPLPRGRRPRGAARQPGRRSAAGHSTRAARRSRRSCGSARGRRQRAARGPNEAAAPTRPHAF